MTRYVVTVLVAGLLLGAAPAPKEDDAKKDREALQGTWKIVSSEEDGKTQEEAKESMVDFQKDTFTIKRGDELVAKGTFKLDPSKKPKTIDIRITEGPREGDKGLEYHGIYEVDKDTMRWCMNTEGKDRPKEFTTKEGTNHSLLTLKRVKP
jgi:uncharacterized protein (TIGR03067 family)